MNAIASTLTTVLVFPGVAWVLIVTIVAGGVSGGLRPLIRGLLALLRPRVPLPWQGAAVAALIGLALLPWNHGNATGTPALRVWLLWSLTEATMLLSLLPALAAADPLAQQRPIRDAQIAAAGRSALWIALIIADAGASEGHVLAQSVATLATILALPLALNWPPWGPARPISWANHLPRPAAVVAPALVMLRETMLAALVVTTLLRTAVLPSQSMLAMQLVAIVAIAAIGRGLRGTVIEQRLAWGLAWWWNIVLPLSAVSVVLLLLQI